MHPPGQGIQLGEPVLCFFGTVPSVGETLVWREVYHQREAKKPGPNLPSPIGPFSFPSLIPLDRPISPLAAKLRSPVPSLMVGMTQRSGGAPLRVMCGNL